MAQLGKSQMKLLISDKEIAIYLTNLINYVNAIEKSSMPDTNTLEALEYARAERKKGVGKWKKKRKKIKDKIKTGVERDLREYLNQNLILIQEKKKYYQQFINKNLNAILKRLGPSKVLSQYRCSTQTGFIKSTGLNLDSSSQLIRRKSFNDFSEDCLFRNMEGNETMLFSKMENNWPFWFIDTGYTNFLNGKKKTWHRLTRNHLHHYKTFPAPVNRLGMFEEFPKLWRECGDKILIIEPGSFSAKTFGINIEQWKNDVIAELRKYTDKKIVIREKLSKKVRKNLYKELCDDDYYCVININSNAATESIWAGVPVITLAKHISNPVAKNSISDVNSLYRGDLANWLCMLSYSQFTYEELCNGVAAEIVKKYHG